MKEDTTLQKQGLNLEYFTVSYNTLEALIAIFLGLIASSIALIGFGLDSIVESLSAIILIWRLKKHGNLTKEQEERIERRATKFVALTFFILGAYVLFESIRKLALSEAPDSSLGGIILAIASLIIMPLLAMRKYSVGKSINSRALIADSRETVVCAFLSVALFLGLFLNYLVGFWQADPIVGIIIFGFLLKEGFETLNEDSE